MKGSSEILAFITDNKERVHSGDPLTLYIEDEAMRKDCVRDIARALHANVVQLKTGDYMIISMS